MIPARTNTKPEYITPTGLRGEVRPDPPIYGTSEVENVPLSHTLQIILQFLVY